MKDKGDSPVEAVDDPPSGVMEEGKAAEVPPPYPRIGFLGPAGSFGEFALRQISNLGNFVPVAFPTMREALLAVEQDMVDASLVAIENSIEGTVNVSLDTLIFETNLHIVREFIADVELSLVARKGVRLRDIKRVVTFPVAVAECRTFLATKLPSAEIVAANSTSEAVRHVSRSSSMSTAAIGTKLAADLYGLQVLQADISDHVGNQTRFVLVSKGVIPAPTGHDRTSIVIFQSDNKAGNLHAYLGQFSARNINLSKLESRPTKRGLGDYCFVIDMEGHVDNEVIADCLRDLHIQAGGVKFLGSYPSGGTQAPKRRRSAVAAWRNADEWVRSLRERVEQKAGRRGGSHRRLEVVK